MIPPKRMVEVLEPAVDVRETLLTRFPEISLLRDGVYIVGGAIRDTLLGREALDVDFACRDAAKTAQRFARDTGGRLVNLGRERFITFRVVAATYVFDFSEIEGDSILADLRRRDLTVNAMAIGVKPGTDLLDPYHGVLDLKRKMVRMVDAKNFIDDPLRMLKTARIATSLGFEIDQDTIEAIRLHGSMLAAVARERVAYELGTMFSRSVPSSVFSTLADLDLLIPLGLPACSSEQLRCLERLSAGQMLEALLIVFASCESGSLDRWCSRKLITAKECQQMRQILEAMTVLDSASGADHSLLLGSLGRENARRLTNVLIAMEKESISLSLQALVRDRGALLFDSIPLLDGHEISGLTGVESGPRLGELSRSLRELQFLGKVVTREDAVAWLRTAAAAPEN